jgi:glyceraldehyde 3-phosphate dehydrogenase
VGLVLPELKGKLEGASIRVPTPNVSLVDLAVVVKRATSADEINGAIKAAAASNQFIGILGWTDEPLVSGDLNHDGHSATFAVDQTSVVDGTLVRAVAWYDNEWGFSNRMIDTTAAFAKTI